jgi:hypothetical protein
LARSAGESAPDFPEAVRSFEESNQIFGGRFIACVVTAGRRTAGLAA